MKSLQQICEEAAERNTRELMCACPDRQSEELVKQAYAAGLLKALQLQEWIPVSERLPDFGKKVLVLGEAKGMNPQMGGAYHIITHRIDLKGSLLEKEADRHTCEYKFNRMNYTTHWRELPEKPNDYSHLEKALLTD